MKKLLHSAFYFSTLVLLCISCTKEVFVGALSEPPANMQYMVDGSNVHVSWNAPSENFDNYTLELSKLQDFTILNDVKTIEKDQTSYIFRKLDLGDTYLVRIRANRLSPPSQSPWSTITYSTTRNNILLPILPAHVSGSTVTVTWDFSKDNSPNASQTVTRILLTPVIGQPRKMILTPQEKEAKTAKISNLAKDELYTVSIYNQNFARGSQTFATAAEAVNGVWTLSPHSNLIAVIQLANSGDNILLRPRVYDISTVDAIIENKSITIKAFSNKPEDRPKVYAKGFILNGASSGLNLNGLDISGSRINEYKQELPNNSDSRWNNWLMLVNLASPGFDAATIENCTIRNYWNGVFNMNDNSIVHHIGGDANFSFTANNFEKRLINCNFYNVLSKQTIYGSNLANMPAYTWELRHPNTIWTEVRPAFIMNDAQHANPHSIKEYPVSFNPGYKNASNMDFSVSPSCPLRSLDNGNPIGDPRWW